jgi:hypothetical protein
MDYMPFVYHRARDEDYRVDFKSLIQALIVAGVTALVVMYGTQQTIIAQLSAIKMDVDIIRVHQQEFRKDFYAPRH